MEYRIDSRTVATISEEYLLPIFIRADLRLEHAGRLRLQIGRSNLDFTSCSRLNALWSTDKEYGTNFNSFVTKGHSFIAGYDTHFGCGGGIAIT